MRKVVFVVPMLAPYSISRFHELAKNPNLDLYVIAEKAKSDARDGSGWNFEQIEGCHTFLLNSKERHYHVKNNNAGYQIRESRKYSFGLKKLVNNIDPDIVIVCNSTQILFLLGLRKYKLGVIVEDTPRAEEGRKKINRYIKRGLLKTADFYLPFNADAVEFLHRNGISKKCYRSSWSIDKKLFNTLGSEQIKEKRALFGIKNKVCYTIIAALIPRKGILQFIDAWKSMPVSFLDESELNIIGDGPLENDIRMIAEKSPECNIHLIGSMPYSKVAEFLQCSDVFVLPTLEDVWGLVIMEAMASGLPVMTTIYAGSREMIHEGENGFVFDVQNKDSIVDSLHKMWNADLKKLGSESKKIIEEYSNPIVMKKMADILLKI